MATTTCKECNQTGLRWSTYWPDGEGPTLLNPDGSLHYRRGSAQVSCPARANRPTGPLVESKAYSLSASFNPDKERQLTEMVTTANDNVRTALSAVGDIGMRMDGLTQTVGASIAANKASIEAALTKLDEARRTELVITINETVKVITQRQHPNFPQLVKMTSARVPVYMRGPAGSGKTTAGDFLSQLYELPFYRVGVNAQTSKAEVFGYTNMATGEYVSTPTRMAFEFGGVLLYDEIDRGLAGMMTVLNTIADNSPVSWPDGKTLSRHKDCVLLAAGNTYGRGADSVYVGANQLDGASLDRFAYLDWDYDWDMVEEISGNRAWARKIRSYYDSATAAKLKVVIGPRAAINGAKLIASGIDESEVEDMVVWSAVGVDHKRTIMNGLPVKTNYGVDFGKKDSVVVRW